MKWKSTIAAVILAALLMPVAACGNALTNQTGSGSNGLPDMVIESVCARPGTSTPGIAGSNYTFTIVIKNIGTAPVTNYFYICYTTLEQALDENRYGNCEIVNNSPSPKTIGPGESIEVTTTGSFTESFSRIGFAINWDKDKQAASSLVIGDTEYRESNYENNTFVLTMPATVAYTMTNVSDTGFSLYWPGQEPTTCYANWGTDPDHLDSTVWNDEGKDKLSATHQVTISGLAAGTSCWFELGAGDTVYRDYCDVPWEFTTPPALGPRAPDTINGETYDKNGLPVDDIIVIITIYHPEQSASLSSVVRDGKWSIDLSQLRTQDFQDYFQYDATTEILLSYWYYDSPFGISGTGDSATVAQARQGIVKDISIEQ